MKQTDGRSTTGIGPVTTAWQRLVVVCRQCSKRGSGPDSFKGKQLARVLRDTLSKAACRHRVVMGSCMGVCPKRAVAVACASTHAPEGCSVWRVGSLEEGRQLAQHWVTPSAGVAGCSAAFTPPAR